MVLKVAKALIEHPSGLGAEMEGEFSFHDPDNAHPTDRWGGHQCKRRWQRWRRRWRRQFRRQWHQCAGRCRRRGGSSAGSSGGNADIGANGNSGSGGDGSDGGGGGGAIGDGGNGSNGNGGTSFFNEGVGGGGSYGGAIGGLGGGGGGGFIGGGGGGGFSGGAGGGTYQGGGGGGSYIDSSALADLIQLSGIVSPDDPTNGEIIITPVITMTSPSMVSGNFQFGMTGPVNVPIVVQTCTNLANPAWIPLTTNTLNNGTNYFTDAQWTNYPCRFYRVSTP